MLWCFTIWHRSSQRCVLLRRLFAVFLLLLLLISIVCPCSASAYTTPTDIRQHACVTSPLNGGNGRTKKLHNRHVLALGNRDALIVVPENTGEESKRLNREKTKKWRHMRSAAPSGEFTPQWYLLPHGPALSITHQHKPRVSGEGVWTFCETLWIKQVSEDVGIKLIVSDLCHYSSYKMAKMNREKEREEMLYCFIITL